ncbi:MAG: response regulator [Candidatus Zhuqueibacterota bacterium]
MKRLLVVEDDPNTLAGMVTLLRDEGYQVHGVINGSAALDAIANHHIDIVLCDFDLPDINGLNVSILAKRLQPNAHFFMITAYYDDLLLDAAEKCGVKKVFCKPVAIHDMLESLNNSTKRRVVKNAVSCFS